MAEILSGRNLNSLAVSKRNEHVTIKIRPVFLTRHISANEREIHGPGINFIGNKSINIVRYL